MPGHQWFGLWNAIAFVAIAVSWGCDGGGAHGGSGHAGAAGMAGASGAGAGSGLGGGAPDGGSPRDGSTGDGPIMGGPCSMSAMGGQISGTVTRTGSGAIAGARITLVGAREEDFREVRTDAMGRFTLPGVADGTYAVGASAPGRAYVEQQVAVSASCPELTVALGPETQAGQWAVIGDAGERFGGTNSAVLLFDGRIIYCHNTIEPVLLEPATGIRSYAPRSQGIQGCHAVSVLPDGRILYVGGTDQEIYGPGRPLVKTFNPMGAIWEMQPMLNQGRWYPTMAPLPDGGFVAAGGGGLDNPVRVKSSEVMDPVTLQWTPVGDIDRGAELSPVVLLYTGEVLMTHRPPQLYDPTARRWRLAADFMQGNRMPNGDHADHEVSLLADGRVVAIGYKSMQPGMPGSLVEIYDPRLNAWALGANQAPVRSRASTTMLPNQRILVMGGYKEEAMDPAPANQWGYMALVDLYDPIADSWRRLAPMNVAREYHSTPMLVPDGRVFILGGEGQPGNEPSMSTVEAYSPPYLSRGPRPEITGTLPRTVRRGDTLTFGISRTAAPTKVVLMGTTARTHFMDSGTARFLELELTQTGSQLSVRIPTDRAKAVYGSYMLFVMVDDIPSVAKIVRIVP